MGIWERIQDWWLEGYSSTHHNPEVRDIQEMKRNIKWLRNPRNSNPEREAMADKLQRIIDREEREAREAGEKGL